MTTRFKSWPRTEKMVINQIVVHESAGWRGIPGALETLLLNNTGVHYMIERTGEIQKHADPATEVVQHAGSVNNTSIGIECPHPVWSGGGKTGAAKWAKRAEAQGLEVINDYAAGVKVGAFPSAQVYANTPQQCESLYRLISMLLQEFPSIPVIMPQALDGKWQFGKLPDAKTQYGGIVAHGAMKNNDHSDGHFVLFYTCLRLGGIKPEPAYAAVKAAYLATKSIHDAYDLSQIRGYSGVKPPEAVRAKIIQAMSREEAEKASTTEKNVAPGSSKSYDLSYSLSAPVDYNLPDNLDFGDLLYDFDLGRWIDKGLV